MEQNQENPSKTDRAVKKYYKELVKAGLLVNDFLEKNGFTAGKPNSKRRSWFQSTYPLHEAVKQGDAYITSKLLLFGADPSLKDMWGRSAYDYAMKPGHLDRDIINILAHHCNGLPMEASSNRWHISPPPVGYEEFFAGLEQDPLVQVGSRETHWLILGGRRRVRSA
eukprot:s470_g1.t1